jgi:hypothetical protein
MGLFDGAIEKAQPMFDALKGEFAATRAAMAADTEADRAVIASVDALEAQVEALTVAIRAANKLAAAEAVRDRRKA